jgi:protein-S-isoprenylcysteine O-methyltransferase Ste14
VNHLPSLGPRGEGWVILQFLLLGLIALAGIRFGGVVNGLPAPAIAWVGLALMVVGAVLVARGLLDLGRSLTPMPHPRDGARLVVSGVYGRARHPIYGGLILTAFGWGLASVSLVTLVLAALLTLFFGLKSRREEAWLLEHYADYAAYMERTRRFWPYLG